MDDSASLQTEDRRLDEPTTGDAHPVSGGRMVVFGLGLAVLTAVTWWLFGNLPWVLSGFSWTTAEAAPAGSSTEGLAGVRVTLPLVARFLPSLIAFTAVGSVAAALLPLVLTTRSGHRVQAIGVVVVSLVATSVVVTLLARSTIRQHASDAFAGDSRVLSGLVLVVFATAAVGALLGTLASLQVGFLPLAAGLFAGQLPLWVTGFLVDRDTGDDALRAAREISHWLVMVVLAVAFVLSVRRSPVWMLLWPVAVAMVWTAAPFGVMTTHLAAQLRPSAGLPESLPDILDSGVDVFRASFWEAPQTRWPWMIALVVALLWVAVERAMRDSLDQTRR